VSARLTLRAGLVFFTFVQTLVGGWMLLSPRSFYDDVPWVAMLPPYNQHLMTDLGGLNLAVALVFGVAAVSLDRLLVRTVLVCYLLYAVPHLVSHSTHLVPALAPSPRAFRPCSRRSWRSCRLACSPSPARRGVSRVRGTPVLLGKVEVLDGYQGFRWLRTRRWRR
jgi:hypothetical protein